MARFWTSELILRKTLKTLVLWKIVVCWVPKKKSYCGTKGRLSSGSPWCGEEAVCAFNVVCVAEQAELGFLLA